LSKEWGQTHGVTPVLYAYPGSAVRENLSKLWKSFEKDEWPLDAERAIGQILSYIKPYSGKFWRDGAYIEDVRFYNEREWRFVPENLRDRGWMIEKGDYLDQPTVTQLNRAVREESRLGFEPRDIRYIIVATEGEVLPMVEDVLKIKGSKYTHDDLRLLTTRIISAEQIRQDF
ncbi:MAG TPA: abortive infection system antitoxin AbiGi family protein, partial [Longimicrobium sp.]|nr:abortive infection system antitoxin AbiGi family protein [Longimicrobium sp.]